MQELFETEPLTSSEQNSQLGKNQHDIDRQWTNHQRDSRCVREKIQMAYERVDRIAMYLFPAIFFVFNLLYWTYYLIVVNIFDLSLFWIRCHRFLKPLSTIQILWKLCQQHKKFMSSLSYLFDAIFGFSIFCDLITIGTCNDFVDLDLVCKRLNINLPFSLISWA